MSDSTAVAVAGERVEYPESAAQVAELLAVAGLERNPVRILGGQGARGLGNRLRPTGWSMSTTRLNRILSYQPTDMTLSVEAGARLADVGAALAEHGQMLPIEAVDPAQATIGGLLATGLAGPRRYGGGTLRDVLIGNAVAYADGTVAKAGGMVVKNVSGFDMMRAHYGAMGTLGVIVSANFKVLPLPRSELTVLARYPDLSAVGAASDRLRSPAVRPVALIVRRCADGWELAARYEGRESGLRAVRVRFGAIVPVDSEYREGDASAMFWQSLMKTRHFERPNLVRLRISVPPSTVMEIACSTLKVVEAADTVSSVEVEPGLGIISLSIEAGNSPPDREFSLLVHRLRADCGSGSVTILTAPDTWKAGLDVWGPEPGTIEIMRALKREFDPLGILNPGCFIGSM